MQLRMVIALPGVLFAMAYMTTPARGAEFADSCAFLDHPGDIDVVCVFHAPIGCAFETAEVSYLNPAESCTSVDAEVWVDGEFVDQTGIVVPGDESPHFDVTSLLADADTVMVVLHHPVCPLGDGCCSTGVVETWGGNIHIAGTISATTSVPQPPYLDVTWGWIKALWTD